MIGTFKYCVLYLLRPIELNPSIPILQLTKLMETVTDFIFSDSRITAEDHCSREIKKHSLPGRKAMTNLGSVLKSRHHFAGKGSYSQSSNFESKAKRYSFQEFINNFWTLVTLQWSLSFCSN